MSEPVYASERDIYLANIHIGSPTEGFPKYAYAAIFVTKEVYKALLALDLNTVTERSPAYEQRLASQMWRRDKLAKSPISPTAYECNLAVRPSL